MHVVAIRGKERIHVLRNKILTKFCNLLTSDQKAQLSTLSYQLKREKRDSKKTATPSKDTSTSSVTLSPTLVDPAHVSVVGVVDGKGTISSPGLSAQPAAKKVEDKKSSSKSDKSTKSLSTASSSRLASVSADHRIDELDQKWSDRFNRLEALLMGRTLDRPQEPTFSTVKVALTHSPPANVVWKEPFIKPTDQPSQHTYRPTTSEPAGTDPPASRHSSASRSSSD